MNGPCRNFVEIKSEHKSGWAAMKAVADLLGVGTPETVRGWVRRGQIDIGARAGSTSDEIAELRRLRQENAELKRANAIQRRRHVGDVPR